MRPDLERQEIRSDCRISGSGLRYLPVEHEGNQSSSAEEADAIRDLVAEIMNANTTWIDRENNEAAIGPNDILIIAPYNAWVFNVLGEVFEGNSLKEMLLEAIRYGDQPEVRTRLSQKIDNALDREHVISVLNREALAPESMSPERLFAVKEEMEKAESPRSELLAAWIVLVALP